MTLNNYLFYIQEYQMILFCYNNSKTMLNFFLLLFTKEDCNSTKFSSQFIREQQDEYTKRNRNSKRKFERH